MIRSNPNDHRLAPRTGGGGIMQMINANACSHLPHYESCIYIFICNEIYEQCLGLTFRGSVEFSQGTYMPWYRYYRIHVLVIPMMYYTNYKTYR